MVKSDDGTPKATFFFVAYTKDDVADPKRPMSFVYNGGPGSASCFTHMGLGPKRIVLTDDGHGMPAPYSMVDNESTFLDATDMVFVDAVSTGYSRPAPGESPGAVLRLGPRRHLVLRFHLPIHHAQRALGLAQVPDRRKLRHHAFGRAVDRSAGAPPDLFERHCAALFGGFRQLGRRRPLQVLPAHFRHLGLVPPPASARPAEGNHRDRGPAARQFAHGDYAAALEKGDELSPAEYQKVVQDLARFTGLSTKYIEQTNLRISPQRWFKELERDKRLTTGRLDSRFTGMDYDAAGESATSSTPAKHPTKAPMSPCSRTTCAAT